jgi:ABC-type lipoprotein export system ATPase subunit
MALLRVLDRAGQTFIIVAHDPRVAAQPDCMVFL